MAQQYFSTSPGSWRRAERNEISSNCDIASYSVKVNLGAIMSLGVPGVL